jgi:SAM-dependent methyltransferase
MNEAKAAVQSFWDEASCGEALYLPGDSREHYEAQSRIRYELEPYILEFADFRQWRGKRVLEIGVGLGADHQMFAQAGAILYGMDLAPRAVQHTRRRLQVMHLDSSVEIADAEALPFADDTFDLVYSWGVLHHSPDTQRAIHEVFRILKPGGEARIMIYHKYSFVGFMLWMRYALLRVRPFCGLDAIYARHLESPGTKAYSVEQANQLFSRFSDVHIRTVLTHGDLLSSSAGQRHKGALLSLARAIWPRQLIQRYWPSNGLFMLVRAKKDQTSGSITA